MRITDPLSFGAVSFMSGILVGTVTAYSGTILVGLLLCGALGLALAASFGWRRAIFPVLVTGAFLLGMGRSGMVVHSEAEQSGGGFTGEALVVDTSTVGWQRRVRVRPRVCVSGELCPTGDILLRTDRATAYTPGDLVSVSCLLTVVSDRPETRYHERRGALARGLSYLCDNPESLHILRADTSGIGFLARMRYRAGESLLSTLPPAEGALASGLLLGGNERLSFAEQERFRAAGLSHIVAISGFNMSIVSGYLFLMAILLGWTRRGATVVVAAGIFLFTVFVGAPASAVRAAVMGTIGFIALAGGRATSGERLLLVASALMIAENPLILGYDLGFQLSVLATAGILATGRVTAYFEHREKLRIIQNMFVVPTIGALLAVMPWIAWTLETIQPYALISNILVLPLVPLAFFLSLLGLVGATLLPSLAVVLAFPAYFVLAIIREVAAFVAAIPYASFSYAAPLSGIVCWYGGLTAVVFLVARLTRQRLLRYVTNR